MAGARRRVAVTGLGALTPLGSGLTASWLGILESKCGVVSVKDEIHQMTGLRYDGLPSLVAAVIPSTVGLKDWAFDARSYLETWETKSMAPFVQYAIAASQDALKDAGWKPTDSDRKRTGVCIGSGIGNLDEIYTTSLEFSKSVWGMRRMSPHFVPKILINLAAGHVAIRNGFTGPNHAVGTACTTGAHAIGDAMRFIQYGDADVMIAGGTEASASPLAMAGFAKARSLSSKFNDDPSAASRPFDKSRDGFVIGEGAGMMVLEEWEYAKNRGARIYAEIVGYGLSGDAHHITAPNEHGIGAARCMKRALEIAGISPDQIDYINAHATSTVLGDLAETRAIHSVFGHDTKVMVSSTKGATGHLLGAAGAVEAVFTVKALHENHVPPTLNLHSPGEGLTLDYVPLEARDVSKRPRRSLGVGLEYALTNSFGFGGTNASLIFKRV